MCTSLLDIASLSRLCCLMNKPLHVKDLFADYLQYLTQKGMSPTTIREHRRFIVGAIAHSIADMKISSLRVIDAARVIEAGSRQGEYGAQRAVVVFRMLMKYAKNAGIIVPIDWRDVEIPNVPQKINEYLDKEELEKIRNSLDITKPAGLRTRALLEVLLDTGMRITEAISLNKADIDWEKREAIITNAKTKDREKIYFTDRSLEWVKKYIDFRNDNLPCVFASGRGRLLSVTSRNYIRTHLQHLGIKKHIKHHIFRKTFATVLIQGGADITAVGDLCRHKSPRTTLRYYAAVNKERSKDLHQQIMNRELNGRVTPEEFLAGTEPPRQDRDAVRVRRRVM